MIRVLVFLAMGASAASAQDFARGGIADPREPRIGIGVIRSNLFADELGNRPGQGLNEARPWDTHGIVQLGMTQRLIKAGGLEIGIQGGAISRFRLDVSDNDALSVDYLIAAPLVFTLLGTQSRVRMIHRSAHLGDELVQNSSIRRLEYDHEEVDLLLSRQFGGIRGYLGGSVTLASSYVRDVGSLQAGLEAHTPLGRAWRLTGGLDWQRHAISEWTDQLNGVVGLERGLDGGRLRIQGRFHSGASHLGEFFSDREKAWGAEVIFIRP